MPADCHFWHLVGLLTFVAHCRRFGRQWCQHIDVHFNPFVLHSYSSHYVMVWNFRSFLIVQLIPPPMSSHDSNLQWSLYTYIDSLFWKNKLQRSWWWSFCKTNLMMMMTITMTTMRLARVLIAFNLNQIVIRVNQVATTGDQDCRCKIRELATNNGISFPKIKYLCLLLFAS